MGNLPFSGNLPFPPHFYMYYFLLVGFRIRQAVFRLSFSSRCTLAVLFSNRLPCGIPSLVGKYPINWQIACGEKRCVNTHYALDRELSVYNLILNEHCLVFGFITLRHVLLRIGIILFLAGFRWKTSYSMFQEYFFSVEPKKLLEDFHKF